MRPPIKIIAAILFTIVSSVLLAIALPQSSHGFSSGGPSLTTIEGNPLCAGPPSANGVLTFNAGQFCDSQTLGTTLTGFQFVLYGNSGSSSVPAATTAFSTVSGSEAVSGTESNAQVQTNKTCTASQLSVFQLNAANANTPVYTLRFNNANTTITCGVGNAGNTCIDNTHSVTIFNNSNFDLQIANPASATATGAMSWSLTMRC